LRDRLPHNKKKGKTMYHFVTCDEPISTYPEFGVMTINEYPYWPNIPNPFFIRDVEQALVSAKRISIDHDIDRFTIYADNKEIARIMNDSVTAGYDLPCSDDGQHGILFRHTMFTIPDCDDPDTYQTFCYPGKDGITVAFHGPYGRGVFLIPSHDPEHRFFGMALDDFLAVLKKVPAIINEYGLRVFEMRKPLHMFFAPGLKTFINLEDPFQADSIADKFEDILLENGLRAVREEMKSFVLE